MVDLDMYEIVDLSQEMKPGILKVNGEYVHGSESRCLEIREFIFEPDKMLMNWVETESHIGTHVEGPSHHPDAGKCLSDLPIRTFIGKAILLRFDDIPPSEDGSRPIEPNHLQEVRAGDIVLMWSSREGEDAPYISPGAAEFLQERGVKMIGIQGVGLEAPGSMASHETFLLNDIPIIEGLKNLEKLDTERFLYIGLPIYLNGIDSSWIRAIALVEK